MRLFIAEKPSLGRAIAKALPGHAKNEKGFITVGDDVVTWCIGHLLEQAPPDAYSPEYKQWKLEHLPIVPTQWQWVPKPKVSSQIAVIRKLLKRASSVVHAGDPDREGQLLVDEMIHYLNYKGPVERVLISDLNTPAVKRSIKAIKNNHLFVPLSTSALARARADWIYGMNMTRAWTLLGRQAGLNAVLSVGRVQTPLLGLIVKRDGEISQFDAHSYYDLELDCQTNSQATFKATWKPTDRTRYTLDANDRALVKDEVQQLANQLPNTELHVNEVKKTPQSKLAPLPFSLSALQIAAGKRFGMSAKQVLDTAQALYEKHQLVTYPRSDCSYIPEQHHHDASNIISSISQFNPLPNNINAGQKSRAFNDKKVSAHHAIIPTNKAANKAKLNRFEENLYELISNYYLAQFLPHYQYCDTKVIANAGSESFEAKGRVVSELGWRVLIGGDNKLPPLPEINSGDDILCLRANVFDKKTKPPQHYTDATLIADMGAIAKHVNDASLKKILKETDGLGTEATRASMIETLEKRQFVMRAGKTLMSTELGRALIVSLPKEASIPDMTAKWERSLSKIAEGEAGYAQFMQDLVTGVSHLLNRSQSTSIDAMKDISSTQKCPKCQQDMLRKRNKKSWYWQCKACTYSASDLNGQLGKPRRAKARIKPLEVNCPECSKPLTERKSKHGEFWGCTNYPTCKYTQKVPKSYKPQLR